MAEEEFRIGDNVCSIVVDTLIGIVSDIVDERCMVIKVNTVLGVKFLLADKNYWRKIDTEK